jgi:hypothetical protein
MITTEMTFILHVHIIAKEELPQKKPFKIHELMMTMSLSHVQAKQRPLTTLKLVPSVAAGAIIGKGGETIASLQKDAGARVKMSKSHDFYPGECSTKRGRFIFGWINFLM